MRTQEKARGRKPVDPDQKMIQRVVTFDNRTAMRLFKLGEGNVSLGIRRATESAYNQMMSEREENEID